MMKVKTRFTLWIALTSFSIALVFSIFVYNEMMEEIDKLLRREVMDTAQAILKNIHPSAANPFSPEASQYPIDRFYISLYGPQNTVIYHSRLAKNTAIPRQQHDGFFEVRRHLSEKDIWLDPLDWDTYDGLGKNRISFFCLQLQGQGPTAAFTLVIGKPLAEMSFELDDLLFDLGTSSIALTLLVIVISYLLAWKLLLPLKHINSQIKNIHENSLDCRIPEGKNRDELSTLIKELNHMFDRLQFSFTRQKEFLSSAAHELRIPLTIIMLTHEELLARELPDSIHEELAHQMDTLRRMNRLVKNLLDLSHLEHQEQPKHSPVHLKEILGQVILDFDDMLQNACITCTVKAEDIIIHGDQDQLVRVCINLLDNAIKYNMPTSGWITVNLHQIKDGCELQICNSGQVIPQQDLTSVFEQFFRVEKSRSVRYGGTGLGLTIVKKIVELHNGSIAAQSSAEKTCFTIYFANEQ